MTYSLYPHGLVKKKRAITAAAHSISPLLRNNSSLSAQISPSIQNTQSIHTSKLLHPLLSPLPNHLRDSTQALQVCTRTYIPSLGQVQIGLQLCAGEPRVKCQNFALAGPQYWPGHRGLSPLTGRYGGLWTILGHSGQVSCTYSNRPRPAGQSQPVHTLPLSLDCRPMAHLVVDCTHPLFFACVDTQLLKAINDTRVQIFDCTLHTTTTTTTTTTTPASPSLSATVSNSNPDSTGTSAIWDSVNTHTPIDNISILPGPLLRSTPSSPSSPSSFPFSSLSQLFTTHAFRAANQRAQQEIPRQAQDTVKKTLLAAGSPPQTPTRLLLVAHPPRPIYRVCGSDILTVLLGGAFLALTLPGILKHVLVSNG
ncbi:hypothetical protein BASA83_010403 [Batrachochytrium salamandrivorans]|nr:hypothetical protein BASA83_010403 [Batrachochytrium salamandrivorans]